MKALTHSQAKDQPKHEYQCAWIGAWLLYGIVLAVGLKDIFILNVFGIEVPKYITFFVVSTLPAFCYCLYIGKLRLKERRHFYIGKLKLKERRHFYVVIFTLIGGALALLLEALGLFTWIESNYSGTLQANAILLTLALPLSAYFWYLRNHDKLASIKEQRESNNFSSFSTALNFLAQEGNRQANATGLTLLANLWHQDLFVKEMEKILPSSALAKGIPLGRVDLSGMNLAGMQLADAYLEGANLSDTRLGGANLSGANLKGADLSGADLSGAYLSGADLSGAKLVGAYLIGAALLNTKWGGIKLIISKEQFITERLSAKKMGDWIQSNSSTTRDSSSDERIDKIRSGELVKVRIQLVDSNQEIYKVVKEE